MLVLIQLKQRIDGNIYSSQNWRLLLGMLAKNVNSSVYPHSLQYKSFKLFPIENILVKCQLNFTKIFKYKII